MVISECAFLYLKPEAIEIDAFWPVLWLLMRFHVGSKVSVMLHLPETILDCLFQGRLDALTEVDDSGQLTISQITCLWINGITAFGAIWLQSKWGFARWPGWYDLCRSKLKPFDCVELQWDGKGVSPETIRSVGLLFGGSWLHPFQLCNEAVSGRLKYLFPGRWQR